MYFNSMKLIGPFKSINFCVFQFFDNKLAHLRVMYADSMETNRPNFLSIQFHANLLAHELISIFVSEFHAIPMHYNSFSLIL